MIARAKALWRAILTPSPPGEGPYQFAVIAIGHAMLGAAFSFGGLAAAAIYWIAKEWGDLRRGGAWRDGLIDTGFVLLGTLYTGPLWWPVAVLLVAGVGALAKHQSVEA